MSVKILLLGEHPMSNITCRQPKMIANTAAANTNGIAVALTELPAAFVSFQQQ
jgi:hypothetical protein